MKTRNAMIGLVGVGMLLMSGNVRAQNVNSGSAGPIDWSSATWVNDSGVTVSTPVDGNTVFIGRNVTNGVFPSSITVSGTEAATHTYVGWDGANGSSLTVDNGATLTTTGQLFVGNNGVSGTMDISGSVAAADFRAGNSGTGTVDLNASGSLTATTLFIGVGATGSTFNHNGGTLTVSSSVEAFYAGTGHTLNLNGNNLSTTSLNIGHAGGSGTLNRGGATVNVTNLDVRGNNNFLVDSGYVVSTYMRSYGSGATITLGADRTVTTGDVDLGSTLNLAGYTLTTTNTKLHGGASLIRGGGSLQTANLQVQDNTNYTYEGTDSVSTTARSYNGSTLTLGKDMNLSSEFRVDLNGAVVDLNSHNLTAPTVFITDTGEVQRTGGGSISTNSLQVYSGSSFTYESADSVSATIRVYNGAHLTLGRDVNITGEMRVDTGTGTQLTTGGYDIQAQRFAFTHADSVIDRTGGGIITADVFESRHGANLLLRSGDVANSQLDFYDNGIMTVTQGTGDTTGLTLSNTSSDNSGMAYLNDFAGSQLALVFDSGSGVNDWVFRWANPTGDTRISAINTFIGNNKLVVSGAAGYEVIDGGDGYTYVSAIPEPASVLLMLLSGIALMVSRRRRK